MGFRTKIPLDFTQRHGKQLAAGFWFVTASLEAPRIQGRGSWYQ
jgi:hypothetical protein